MKNKKTILIASALALVVLLVAVAIPLSMNTATPSGGGGGITNNTGNGTGNNTGNNTDNTDNGGGSADSGSTQNCAHTQGASQYEIVDAEGHVVFAQCTKCNAETLRRYEDHEYDAGKCTVCEYECTHTIGEDVYTFDGYYSFATCSACGIRKSESANPNASFSIGGMSFEFGKGMTWQDFIEDPTNWLYGSNEKFIVTEYEGNRVVAYQPDEQEILILLLDGEIQDVYFTSPVDCASYDWIKLRTGE